MRKKSVNLKLIIVFCILALVFLNSCGSENNSAVPVVTSDVEFSPSGHVLYGYKHGVKIYGQYMDQAGDDNAMILLFVEKEEGSSAEVICQSVSINDVQVNPIIKNEMLTSQITAIEIQVSSSNAEVDELQSDSYVAIEFEIIDSTNGNILDKTYPISFRCNLMCANFCTPDLLYYRQ